MKIHNVDLVSSKDPFPGYSFFHFFFVFFFVIFSLFAIIIIFIYKYNRHRLQKSCYMVIFCILKVKSPLIQKHRFVKIMNLSKYNFFFVIFFVIFSLFAIIIIFIHKYNRHRLQKSCYMVIFCILKVKSPLIQKRRFCRFFFFKIMVRVVIHMAQLLTDLRC